MKSAAQIALFALVASMLYATAWNDSAAGFLSDDSVYVLMADAFSPFYATDAALDHYVLRQSLFPPVYPLLLALFGAGSNALLQAHLVTTTTFVIALLLFWRWTRVETNDDLASLGLMLSCALLPGFLRQNLDLMSEAPYLMFSMGALLLASRRPLNERAKVTLALCVGLAAGTRTAGVSLLLAAIVWFIRHRRELRLRWLLVACLPLAVWSIYKSIFIQSSGGGYQHLWKWLFNRVRDDPLGYPLQFLSAQALALWSGLLANFDLRPTMTTEVVLGLTLAIALASWARRLWHWRMDAWYVLIGGAMTLLYPFPDFSVRLTLPWIPLLLFYAYLGLRELPWQSLLVRSRPVLAYTYVMILLLSLIPSLGFIAHRWAEPIDPSLANWKHTRYWYRFETMDAIRADVAFRAQLLGANRGVSRFVPPGKCVYGVHTAIGMLYSHRVFEQPPVQNDETDFERLVGVCDYFLLVSTPGAIGAVQVPAYYPQDLLNPAEYEALQAWEQPDGSQTAVLMRRKTSAAPTSTPSSIDAS